MSVRKFVIIEVGVQSHIELVLEFRFVYNHLDFGVPVRSMFALT